MWSRFIWLGMFAMVPLGAGCANSEPTLRPPKPQEEFISPPQEATYTLPIQYPAESLDQDPLLKKNKSSTPGLMGRPGTGGQRPYGM